MDSRICQTSTASPAEPGGLSSWASFSISQNPQLSEVAVNLHQKCGTPFEVFTEAATLIIGALAGYLRISCDKRASSQWHRTVAHCGIYSPHR